MKSVDVIVPVLNEEQILPEFIRRGSSLGLDLNLIFIDNASTDRSPDIVSRVEGARLIRHDSNRGYGGSLIHGMAECSSDYVIVIDADCEYPPEAIPSILDALQTHPVVYTSRLLGRKSSTEANMPQLKMLGNRIISTLFNLFFAQSTTDLYTGCKGFRRDCLEGLNFRYTGFEHVLEFACLLSRRGYRIHDVPVDFQPRASGKSKMKHVSETVKFLALLVYFRLLPMGSR